jgi:hypothetical protein
MAGGTNDLYGSLGAKGWTPLLHLAFTRLPIRASNDNAVEIARLLLDAGADPNAFFHAGDSHYTAMTGVAGEGEEDRPPHPRRDELTQLFLDHGANPYDIQVVYNLGFHAEYLWWLPMIYAHSVTTGRADDWRDPEWKMLDMGGYGCGARWFLDRAIRYGNVDLAAWCLEHGAGPNVPPARAKRMLQTPYMKVRSARGSSRSRHCYFVTAPSALASRRRRCSRSQTQRCGSTARASMRSWASIRNCARLPNLCSEPPTRIATTSFVSSSMRDSRRMSPMTRTRAR